MTKSAVTYFIADLHLATNRPDITACFLLFLKRQAVNADALYILGDFFEYWIGDDDNSQLVTDVANALSELTALGTPVYFIHGNRDFLLGKKYANISGMALLPEVTHTKIYNHDMVIMHGDTLCTADISYQKFRKKSRSWWWQAIVKNLPLKIRKKMADNYRQKSALATSMKSQDIMDVTQEEVLNTLSMYDSQLLIHGHTHRPDVHEFTANGESAKRIVLGDWYEQGSYLKVTPDSIELLQLKFS